MERQLEKDLDFLIEIDKMKSILRMTSPIKSERREDDAQHSWHVAVMALILEEYADEDVDISRVIEILLVHDLVEIYAGDTFCYDQEANKDKKSRENRSAEKLFGILGGKKADYIRGLWDEFEEALSPEAKFANALDRLQPIILNYYNSGGTWRQFGVKESEVCRRVGPIKEISGPLWDYTLKIIESGRKNGWIKEG